MKEFAGKIFAFADIEVDWEIPPADAARIEEDLSRLDKLKSEADAIAGSSDGEKRFLKVPLLLGLSAVFLMFGVMLWGTGASVIAGITSVLTGVPIFTVTVILFVKFKKAQPLYKDIETISKELTEFIEKTKPVEPIELIEAIDG